MDLDRWGVVWRRLLCYQLAGRYCCLLCLRVAGRNEQFGVLSAGYQCAVRPLPDVMNVQSSADSSVGYFRQRASPSTTCRSALALALATVSVRSYQSHCRVSYIYDNTLCYCAVPRVFPVS